MCLLQLYAYEYKCVTDLGPISLTGLLAPFAVHVHCHMIAYVTVINVSCIQKDQRHQLLYYCWRPPWRSDDIRNMFFFISCDIEYSFSITHVYLLFGVIYAMTCMYIYGNKAFWNWNWNWCIIELCDCYESTWKVVSHYLYIYFIPDDKMHVSVISALGNNLNMQRHF